MTRQSSADILWDVLDRETWEARFAVTRRSTLLQSFGYARAVCPEWGQRPRHGLIRIGGEPAGIVQVQEAYILRRAVHALILDRGPLWFDGWGAAEHVGAFLAAFDHAFPRRLGRRRRIMPEVEDTGAMRAAITNTRLKPVPEVKGYETIWLDLTRSEDALRAGLLGRWRNALVQAERHFDAADLEIDWHWDGKTLPRLVAAYKIDRDHRGYPGPAPGTVMALCRSLLGEGRVLIGNARVGGEIVASILILGHGAAATYQIGWTLDAGREHNATHLLLWRSFAELKTRGYRDLDLGGISEENAGLTRFKEGIGGERVRLIGQFM